MLYFLRRRREYERSIYSWHYSLNYTINNTLSHNISWKKQIKGINHVFVSNYIRVQNEDEILVLTHTK